MRSLPGLDAFIKKCDKGVRIDNALAYEQEAQGKSEEQYPATRGELCNLWK